MLFPKLNVTHFLILHNFILVKPKKVNEKQITKLDQQWGLLTAECLFTCSVLSLPSAWEKKREERKKGRREEDSHRCGRTVLGSSESAVSCTSSLNWAPTHILSETERTASSGLQIYIKVNHILLVCGADEGDPQTVGASFWTPGQVQATSKHRFFTKRSVIKWERKVNVAAF